MPSDYLCPRCDRTYRVSWLHSGRCDHCRETLVPWLPLPLRQRAARGEMIQRANLSGWPSLAAGVRVWSAVNKAVKPMAPGDLFLELPSGDTSPLERREQLAQAGVILRDAREALAYVRFLHGYDKAWDRYGGELKPLLLQAPSYIELAREFQVLNEAFTIEGLDGATSQATAHEHHEGDRRWFQIVRHVMTRESLPRTEGKPQPLTGVLRLEETVSPDGRYACEASEPPRQAVDYRHEAARPFEGLSIALRQRFHVRGRPLQIDGAPAVAALSDDGDWG